MKKELLAPAGDIEAGYAALYYGADAVYLGLQQFSARATATNFSEELLNEFVGYAHHLKRKVYVALNTLLQENELPDLLKNLDICVRCGVDALIVQDLGVARVVKEKYPELDLHASTQMAVHNKEGALALQNLGFSRVVLARELTLAEIKEIAALPGLETEAFIHGALCYSYSGLCLFSSVETGRSANRGKCLYPCRAEFEGEEGKKHYFSMKDMALQEDVLKMPVTSLKIEGRKKTALYVAAVTDYYRKILDGKGAEAQSEDNIKQIFARPWSKFHFNGRYKDVIDRDFVGHRGLQIGKIEQVSRGKIIFRPACDISRHDGLQIDVEGQEKPYGFSLQRMRVRGQNVFEAKAGETVEILLPPGAPFLQKGQFLYLASSSRVKGAYNYAKPKTGDYRQREGIKVVVQVFAKEIKASVGNFESKLSGDFVLAQDPHKTTEAIQKAFSKTGETDFELMEIEINNAGERFVPVSLLNELRRDLYAKIKFDFMQRELPPLSKERSKTEAKWVIKTDQPQCLSKIDLQDVAEIIILVDENSQAESWKILPRNKLRFALPALCRNPRRFEPLVKSLLGQGYKKWEIGNYWGLSMLPEKGIDLSFDAPLYMMNLQAVQMAKECGASRITLSWEDNLENWQKLAALSPLPVTMAVYENVPLFTSAACVRSNPCKACPQGTKWMKMSKNGEKYLILSKNCQTIMFADKPLCFATEADKVEADFYRVDLMYHRYTPEQTKVIWDTVRQGKDLPNIQKANLNRKI